MAIKGTEMQKYVKLIFTVYILVLIKMIVFKYPYEQLIEIASSWQSEVIGEGIRSANFIPFKTVKMYIEYASRLNSFENLAGNILAFVPFGLLFPFVNIKAGRSWPVFLNAFALAASIELFQLASAFGVFDVDDIILNCLGAGIGYALYMWGISAFPVLGRTDGPKEEIEG